jgi:peroxiredoxin
VQSFVRSHSASLRSGRGLFCEVRGAAWSILLLILLFSTGCRPRSGLNPGEVAPYFTMKDLSGRDVSRDDLEGKATVLSFWASWCEPCIKELPALERLHSILAPRGGRVVSIGIDDSRENLAKVVSNQGITFPVLLDESGLAKQRYQVKGVPETFLLNSSNRIAMLAGRDGKVEVRLTGPREWDDPRTVELLLSALGL